MSNQTTKAIADRERRTRGEPPPRPAKPKKQPAEQPSAPSEAEKDGG